jgi:peptidoglycan L-alanyl-D-glutamate endopeptidase CwlK
MLQEINRDIKLIHPDLIKFFNSFSAEIKNKFNKDFKIFEGHRTLERQKVLFSQGYSKTLKSRHLSNPSEAIDILEYPWTWSGLIVSKEYFDFTGNFLKNYNNIEWGGNWITFKDYPHFQIKK